MDGVKIPRYVNLSDREMQNKIGPILIFCQGRGEYHTVDKHPIQEEYSLKCQPSPSPNHGGCGGERRLNSDRYNVVWAISDQCTDLAECPMSKAECQMLDDHYSVALA